MISLDEKKKLIKQKREEVPPHVIEMGLNMLFTEPIDVLQRLKECKQIEPIKIENIDSSTTDTIFIDISSMPYSSEIDNIAFNKSLKPKLAVIVYDIMLEEYQVYLHRIYQIDAIMFPVEPLTPKSFQKIVFIANSMGILPIPFIKDKEELKKIEDWSIIDVVALKDEKIKQDKTALLYDSEKEIIRCLTK
ncbi:hypothetical protein [Hippea maritima]|uniref:Uncharacterized protein n=1 Tax=Hippea maritima (strain ATCC 700847 / DSM 10411 / MH2) TaxID=760142 RepID=F2LW04_HIPMA|nr:hypothetical protein [Hippea maritima]AEA33938.1 hypothetical protein Hipma_0972 [Hippea maritima DSM 10411]